jgi:hypothetical protein
MEKKKSRKFTDTMPIYDKKLDNLRNIRMHKKINQNNTICSTPKISKKQNTSTKEKLMARLKKYLDEYANEDFGNKYLLAIFDKDNINQNIVNTSFFQSTNMEIVKEKFERDIFKNRTDVCVFKKTVY